MLTKRRGQPYPDSGRSESGRRIRQPDDNHPNFTLKDTPLPANCTSAARWTGSVTLENVRVLGRITVIGGARA